jgi:uncharacterized membrane protein YjgN (DUF898 family)
VIATTRFTGDMAGTRSDLLSLVLKTTTLTVLTLGIYSFWARTRIRRWLWSSLRVDGMPFEYAGRPLEKLMGFVIAAVIVAIYLGLVVMVLIFTSLNLFGGVGPGTAAAFALLLPVYWFAKYRGQRYLLNHTRWRGIAFSMAPGAWGYLLRATCWTIATVLTAGILLPLRAHRLWQYRVERTYYGDDHFRFDTKAGDLYPHFGFVLIGLFGSLLSGVYGFMRDESALVGLLIFVPLLLFGWVYWRVASFRILASGLRFGGAMDLTVAPRTGAVIGIHLLGWILMGLLFLAVAAMLAFAFGFFAVGAQANVDLEVLENLSPYLLAVGGILFYLTFFVLRGALRIAMVTFPLFRHVARTLSVSNAVEVNAVCRGEASHMADADGFANLFDFGSGV